MIFFSNNLYQIYVLIHTYTTNVNINSCYLFLGRKRKSLPGFSGKVRSNSRRNHSQGCQGRELEGHLRSVLRLVKTQATTEAA